MIIHTVKIAVVMWGGMTVVRVRTQKSSTAIVFHIILTYHYFTVAASSLLIALGRLTSQW